MRGLVEPESESRAQRHEKREEERGADDQRDVDGKDRSQPLRRERPAAALPGGSSTLLGRPCGCRAPVGA